MKNKVFVLVCPVIENYSLNSFYPLERKIEIENCKNSSLKNQKYTVFALLKYALENIFNVPFKSVNFYKSSKWESDKFIFSFSHTSSFVAVAVCLKNDNVLLGVDLEKIQDRFLNLYPKFCSSCEIDFLKNEPNLITEKACVLWTKKESYFKANNDLVFVPKNIETSLYSNLFTTQKICSDYYITVFSSLKNVEFIFVEKL